MHDNQLEMLLLLSELIPKALKVAVTLQPCLPVILFRCFLSRAFKHRLVMMGASNFAWSISLNPYERTAPLPAFFIRSTVIEEALHLWL